MAFGGLPGTVTQISDRVVRLTGQTLANGASGTIALSNGPASDIALPATFTPDVFPSALGAIADRIRFYIVQQTAAATGQPYHVAKAGATQALFQITVTNDGAAGSGALEMYVELLG